MLYTEFRFVIFFAVVFVLYWATRSNTLRKLQLLLASYYFYGAWNPKFLLLIVASTVIDYFIGIQLGRGDPADPAARPARRRWLLVSMLWNLGVLCLFKYFNFFIESGQAFLGWLGLHTSPFTLKLILPVGISFFTFQSMSYSIDIYRGHLRPTKNLLDFSTFIAFFPQLFAGPIVRAVDFLPQLHAPRMLAKVNGRAMVLMFLVGYIKKACVADNLAPFVDDYFANPGAYSWVGCWTAVLFYAGQIYCDFSGYTDMAIAAAGLLGYEFCQNFDFPYFSKNVSEFWRRWHMSLSSWLRDYLYIPLGGNRGGRFATHRNLMATMVLGGLWHGAAWTFVIWGALHGTALAVHREATGGKRKSARTGGSAADRPAFVSSLVTVLAVAFTFYWICVAWIFFRAPSTHAAFETCASFMFFRSPGTADFGNTAIAVFVGLALVHWLAYRRPAQGWWQRVPTWQFAAGCGLLIATALPWTPLRYQPFIYFQF